MNVENKLESIEYTEYHGRRREAALLALTMVGGSIAAVTTALIAGAHKPLMDVVGCALVGLVFGLVAWAGLVLVRVHGMTLRVKGRAIEVEEWYGRRYTVPLKLPIVADHFMPVNIGRKLKLRLQEHQWRLSVGGVDVYVNLEERSNPDEAMSNLLVLLDRMAQEEQTGDERTA